MLRLGANSNSKDNIIIIIGVFVTISVKIIEIKTIITRRIKTLVFVFTAACTISFIKRKMYPSNSGVSGLSPIFNNKYIKTIIIPRKVSPKKGRL